MIGFVPHPHDSLNTVAASTAFLHDDTAKVSPTSESWSGYVHHRSWPGPTPTLSYTLTHGVSVTRTPTHYYGHGCISRFRPCHRGQGAAHHVSPRRSDRLYVARISPSDASVTLHDVPETIKVPALPRDAVTVDSPGTPWGSPAQGRLRDGLRWLYRDHRAKANRHCGVRGSQALLEYYLTIAP